MITYIKSVSVQIRKKTEKRTNVEFVLELVYMVKSNIAVNRDGKDS